MKETYTGSLRCATCGSDDSFEFDEDKSYIKCIKCGREYFGGYDELLDLNQDAIEEVQEQIKSDAEEYIRKAFQDAFKGNKNIRIK